MEICQGFLFFLLPNDIHKESQTHAHGEDFPIGEQRAVKVRGESVPAPHNKSRANEPNNNRSGEFSDRGKDGIFLFGVVIHGINSLSFIL